MALVAMSAFTERFKGSGGKSIFNELDKAQTSLSPGLAEASTFSAGCHFTSG
jgi:hypothetical protein